VDVCYVSIRTGLLVGREERRDVRVSPNRTTDVMEKHRVDVYGSRQHVDQRFDDYAAADPFVVQALLLVDGKCVASDVSWPEPIKYLSFGDRGVRVECSADMATAFVSAAKPVKGFVFSERKGTQLSDNGFDIMPGEIHEVRIEGCAANELEWRYVDM
jgi:beta-mannosidase